MGDSCQKWLEPGSPKCYNHNVTPKVELHENDQAGWCKDPWCYVEACVCDAADATQSYYFPDITLQYSYSTCGSTDKYTQNEHGVVPGNEEACGVTSGAFQAAIMPGTILLLLVMLQQQLKKKDM